MRPLRFDAIARFTSRYFSVAGVGMLALSMILAIFPLHSLFVVGPLHWQVHGGRFWYGGMEAMVFAAALVATCLLARTAVVRSVTVCVIGLLYLRLHYVDLPLISGILYVEAILAIGRLLTRGWQRSEGHAREFMLHLLCGIGAYSILIAALSVIHLAYPGVLYAVVLSTGLLAAVITRHMPYSYLAVRNGVSGERVERLVFAVLYMTVLVMAAKTNLINDYDSQWYGLRSNYVLEQGGSIFVNLGLSHFVFYYPKLYEALILPLCAFPDSSYPAALNILVYAVILYVVRDMVIGVTGNRSLAALVTLVTGWVPVVVFTALLVKPDLLTALVLLIAARYLMRFVTDGMSGDGLIGAAALAIALCGKLTAIPYGGLMFIAAALVLGISVGRVMFGKGRGFVNNCSTPQLMAFSLGLATFAVFTWRTYVITGLPYIAPDFLVKTLQSLGFAFHFPYVDFPSKVIGGVWHFDWQSFGTLYEALMQPSKLGHIVFSWIGNVFVLTALVAISTFGLWRKTGSFARPFLMLCVPLFLLTLVFISSLGKVYGGDGNYYVFPIIFFTAFSAVTLHYTRSKFRGWAIAALLLSTMSDGFAWFASTPLWNGGTAAYSVDLFKSTFDSGPKQEVELEGDGLARIAGILNQAAKDGHCTALADGDEEALFKLHCALESARTISNMNSKYFTDTGTLSSYISQAKFDFIIVPDVPQATLLSKVFANYAVLPGAIRIDDELYSALDLRGVTQALPVFPAQPGGNESAQQSLSLVKYFSKLKADYPDTHAMTPRPAFATADMHLKKYLGGDALVLRTGTSVVASSDVIPFACPGKLSFDLGLLPADQLAGVDDGVLSISWLDEQGSRVLERVDLKVPPHGFQHQEIPIGECGKQGTTLTLHAQRGPNAKYAYILMTDPLLRK